MLRTDRPAAPASLMFAGCRWHRWPHNHCWAHRGRSLIFKAFLLQWFGVHPWDWSQWFICTNMCLNPHPYHHHHTHTPDLGGGRLQGLSSRHGSGWEWEGRCDGHRASSESCLWAPLIKAARAQRAMVGERKSCRCLLLCLQPNSKFWKIEMCALLKMKW